jgi:hypothetical protein
MNTLPVTSTSCLSEGQLFGVHNRKRQDATLRAFLSSPL